MPYDITNAVRNTIENAGYAERFEVFEDTPEKVKVECTTSTSPRPPFKELYKNDLYVSSIRCDGIFYIRRKHDILEDSTQLLDTCDQCDEPSNALKTDDWGEKICETCYNS